ncbi:MAG: hypothetical protein IT560_11035 [Alphaproteobacteria bacterium]|nr:hypothetical protein [Alphaproteobacteria bacterium]
MSGMKTDISGVVQSTVVETFNGMLGQNVVSADERGGAAAGDDGRIYACLLLDQARGASANFCFTFDGKLLARTAARFYPPEQAREKTVQEDIACAIANIVGSKVKSCLNKYGHDFEMTVPFVAEPAALPFKGCDTIHLHFSWNDNAGAGARGLVVDFGMDQRPTGNC